MHIDELINELRRNPVLNVKAEGHAAAVKFLEGLGRAARNYGVSMTSLPKLGINPASRYNTPVGIYFYPAEYYMRKIGRGKQLEFQHDAPYIQIFELKGNIEDIGELTQDSYRGYINLLQSQAGKIGTLINKSEVEVHRLIVQLVSEAGQSAKNDSYGGYLWYVLYALSFYGGKEKRTNAPPRSSVVWNSILRLIGIDGLIDEGSGIIHENEPYQGVVLDPRSVKHVNTFKNRPEEDDAYGNIYKTLADTDEYLYYVQDVIEAIRDHDLKYNNKYQHYCKVIIDKVLRQLAQRPEIYRSYSSDQIFRLLNLTLDPKIKGRIVVDFYVQRFSKLQAELIDMVDMWEEYKSQPNWDAQPEGKKQRAFALSAPPTTVHQAQTTLKHLTIYKDDPKAQHMIKYIEDMLARLS